VKLSISKNGPKLEKLLKTRSVFAYGNNRLEDIRNQGRNLVSSEYAILAFPDSIRYLSENRWTRVKKSLQSKHICEEFDTLHVSVEFFSGMLVQKESFFRSYFKAK